MMNTFTAKEAQEMMLHKDDILIGLFGHFYGAIQAAAYAGNSGVELRCPVDYVHYMEFEVRIKQMMKNGFIVTEGYITEGEYVFEVYWNISHAES